MNVYDKRLRRFIHDHAIDAEQLCFTQSCHSVAEAAAVVGAEPQDFVKNICLTDERGRVIVAIVKGEHRASTSRVAKVLGIPRVDVMTPKDMLEKTGYPCGGTPSFGFSATFLVDPKVMEKTRVYTGGGSETSLVRASPTVLLAANDGTVVRIRK